ncbi:MAG: dihydrolipoamide acetyltransferase family protein [Pseudomonadota bacterium]
MVQEIFIPKLGMTMEEATIAEWRFEEGAWVEHDEVVLVIDTEKVAHEMEAAVSGFLVIIGERGKVYPCGTVVGLLAETKAAYDVARTEDRGIEVRKEKTDMAEGPDDPPELQPGDSTTEEKGRIFITPLARRIAENNRIDISRITGTGPNGRIKKRDIERALSEEKTVKVVSRTERVVTAAAAEPNTYDGKRVKESIPVTGMRKVIAEHTHYSLSVSAQVTVMTEIEMTEIIKLRSLLNEKVETIGSRISYTDIFIFAVAKAVKVAPLMNSSLIGNEIKIWEDINIGFATSLSIGENQSGLVVPVVKNADRLGLAEICKARIELMNKAKEGKLSTDDMAGGTFSITNTSMFTPGWHIQTPIINQPQSAILGTSATVERPVVKEGQIVIRPIMPISLTFDHRVLDGIQPSRFIAKFKEMIEEPYSMLL